MSTVNQVVKGLRIIAKYTGDGYDVNAEHDIIYAGATAINLMPTSDQKAMEEAGWHWDNDVGSYAIFV